MHIHLRIEMNLSEPMDGTTTMDWESNEKGFRQKIEYKGNNALCTKCGLLRHFVGVCRESINQPKQNTGSMI